MDSHAVSLVFNINTITSSYLEIADPFNSDDPFKSDPFKSVSFAEDPFSSDPFHVSFFHRVMLNRCRNIICTAVYLRTNDIGPPVYPKGSLVITSVVCRSVFPSVRL